MLWQLVLAIYTLLSLAAFIAQGRDKRAAIRKTRRTPEATLHLLELLGGWPGALLARRLYRHKTKKTSYRIVFWLIVAAHIAAWATFLWFKQK